MPGSMPGLGLDTYHNLDHFRYFYGLYARFY